MPEANIKLTLPSSHGSAAAESCATGVRIKTHAQQTQIHEQHGASRHAEAEQMEGLDHREQPGRIADRLADRGLLAPFEEGQQIHQNSDSVGTQLVRKLISADCGCRSQSNQL